MLPLSPPEMIVIMALAVLLFGKRLPDVGRSLGKSLVEFRKGLRGMEDEFQSGAGHSAERIDSHRAPDVLETTVPKFEPPTAAPVHRTDPDPQPRQD